MEKEINEYRDYKEYPESEIQIYKINIKEK